MQQTELVVFLTDFRHGRYTGDDGTSPKHGTRGGMGGEDRNRRRHLTRPLIFWFGFFRSVTVSPAPFPLSVPSATAGSHAGRRRRQTGRRIVRVRPQHRTGVPAGRRPVGFRVQQGRHGQTDGRRSETGPGHRSRVVRLRKGMYASTCVYVYVCRGGETKLDH